MDNDAVIERVAVEECHLARLAPRAAAHRSRPLRLTLAVAGPEAAVRVVVALVAQVVRLLCASKVRASALRDDVVPPVPAPRLALLAVAAQHVLLQEVGRLSSGWRRDEQCDNGSGELHDKYCYRLL